MSAPDLEPPAVSPSAYDETYYRQSCMGNEEWAASGGRDAHGAYSFYLDFTNLAEGETLIDVGTGRGELVALAAERGAARAVGVEYSSDAVELARETLAAHGDPSNAEVLLADARRLPFPDATADVATLFDVVEHLTPTELDGALQEIRRVLRPGGRLYVHTTPNRLIYDVTWPALRLFHRGWPRDPRNDLEREMHVNEQTRQGLGRALKRSGLQDVNVWYGQWVHDVVIPTARARRMVRWLARHRATAWLGAADLWATGRC